MTFLAIPKENPALANAARSRCRFSCRVWEWVRKGPSRFFLAHILAASSSESSAVASASFRATTSSATPFIRNFWAIILVLRPEVRSEWAFIPA